MRRNRGLAALAFAGVLAACGDGGSDEAADAAPERPAVQVETVAAEVVSIEDPVVGTGTIAPIQRTNLGPRVDGIIEEILVRVGQRVEEGDVLFRTRDVDLKFKVQELENELKLAEATAVEAERNHNRIVSLKAKGVASAGALDKSRAAHEAAQARLGIAEAKLGQARQALEDAVVKAPFDGVVTARNVDEGTFMATRMGGGGGGGSMGPSGVVEIMEIHIVGAIVYVPEVHLSKLKLGTPATVIIDGLDESFDSEIHRINDFIDPVKRTVEVRIGLRNDDYRIKPGSFARALLYPPAREALTVPRSVVLGFEDQQYVYVDDNGTAKRQPVRTRQLDAERIEIVEGLEPGDRVLSGPALRTLAEGDPVTVSMAETPARVSAVTE